MIFWFFSTLIRPKILEEYTIHFLCIFIREFSESECFDDIALKRLYIRIQCTICYILGTSLWSKRHHIPLDLTILGIIADKTNIIIIDICSPIWRKLFPEKDYSILICTTPQNTKSWCVCKNCIWKNKITYPPWEFWISEKWSNRTCIPCYELSNWLSKCRRYTFTIWDIFIKCRYNFFTLSYEFRLKISKDSIFPSIGRYLSSIDTNILVIYTHIIICRSTRKNLSRYSRDTHTDKQKECKEVFHKKEVSIESICGLEGK